MTDSPAGNSSPQAAEPQIPKARLDEVLGKNRELETRMAEALAKLKDLEAKAVDPSKLEATQKAAESAAAAKAQTERQLEAARLANRNQWTEEAATLVLDMQTKGLSPQAAAAAAMAEKPGLFQKAGANEYRAATHGSLPPQTGTPQPEVKTIATMRDRMKAGQSHKDAAMAHMAESGLLDRIRRSFSN